MKRQFWTVHRGIFYQYEWEDFVPTVTNEGDAWLDSLATAALYAGGI